MDRRPELDDDEPESCMFLTIFRGDDEGHVSETENLEDGPVAKTRVGPCPPAPDMGPAVGVDFFLHGGPTVVQVLMTAAAAEELAGRITRAAAQARAQSEGG